MTDRMEGQVAWSDLGLWSGKMFQEPSQATKEKTFKRSSRKSSGSATPKLPMCLCLTRESGQNQDVYTMNWEDGALLGEYTIRSFGEFPNEENASRLSQILEDLPHPKYSLSAKACQGILTRAERRGKMLPKELEEALRVQSAFKSEPENRGGKGILIQDEHIGALSTLQNQSVLVYGVDAFNQCQTGSKAKSITSAATDSDHLPCVYCLQGGETSQSSRVDGINKDVSFTLNAVDRHAAVKVEDDGETSTDI